MIVVAGCEIPQEPGELSWDVNLNVPFGVRTYGMWELVEPDSVLHEQGSGIGMTEDSALYFSAWADLSASIGDSLYLDALGRTIDRYLTAIEAPLDYDTLLQFTLGSLNPDLAALHGQLTDIPQHSLLHNVSFSLPAGYDSLEVDTGTIELVVVNRLPYAITNVALRIGNRVVVTIDTIATEQQFVGGGELRDAVLNGSFDVALAATGEGGAGIQVDSTRRISLTARVDTVTASRFYGFVPEQTVVRDSAVAIEQQHAITQATIASGALSVTIANHTQFADTVTLVIPNLISRLNDTLSVTRYLLPGDSDVTSVPLAQYRLRPDGETEQTITGKLISHTPPTSDRRAFEANGEHVYGHVELERMSFEFFQGTLNNLNLPFDGIEIELERPPQGWETVQPLDVEARLHVGEGVSGTLDATVLARTTLQGNAVGEGNVIVNDLPLGNDTTVVVEGLAALLSQFPDLLTAEGDAVLNGPVALYSNALLNVDVELRAGLSVRVTGDIEPAGTVERIAPEDLKDILSGEVTVQVWNHLPTGGRCFLVADYDSLNVLSESGADVDTLFDALVPAPTVSEGRAVDTSHFEIVIPLAPRWLDYFRSDGFFVRTQIEIGAMNGDTLTLHGGDFLAVQPVAKLSYRVNPGDIE